MSKYTLALAISLVLLSGTLFVTAAYADDATPPQTDTSTPTPPPDTSTPPADTTPSPSTDTSNTSGTSNTPDPSTQTPPPNDGSNGQNGGDPATPPPGSGGTGTDGTSSPDAATITTGNADSGDTVNNNLNSNTVDATDTPSNASTTIADSNDATTTNTADATSSTGDNTASGGGGSASVSTGNAFSFANVINVVNTNIINSTGLLDFLNLLFSNSIDLRTIDFSSIFGGTADPSTSGGCSLSTCGTGSLNVNNANNANVTNTMIVRANTGDNTATGDGNTSISTGDAYAAGNAVNLVNTNVINSHYLLVALNNFGDLNGDITLPGADFFNQLFAAHQASLGQNTTIDNTNTATVNSTSSADASTGDNAAVGSGNGGSGSVSTGNAYSGNTTLNQVNSNYVGGTTVYMLINVIGDWTGGIQGLPDGMSWVKTPTGVMLVGNGGSTSNGGLGSLNVNNTNTAMVNNDVHVYALTGDNYAGSTGTSSAASITTGNAYASSNVVNIVNTNVIGQNWMLAIFNIFGNWNGNLAFGHPDLWIGGVAQTPNPTKPGAPVTYTFTVANHGDADATNVKISAAFNRGMLDFGDPQDATNNGDQWDLGNIPKGETKQYSYTATAGAVAPGSSVSVPLTATVTSDETDNNPSDNTENVTIVVGQPNFSVSGLGAGPYTPDPKITIKKTVSVSTTTLPASVDYKVVIDNDGGPAYNTKLTDVLKDPDGVTVYTRDWDLDEIDQGDEITLTYTVQYSTSSFPGIYTNTARLTGQRNNAVAVHAVDMVPVEGWAQIDLEPAPQVLGAHTQATSCPALITSFMGPDAKNDPTQVTALQTFLVNEAGAKGVKINGIYDAATVAAVKAFQNQHKGDVLSPWGIVEATGVVYYTTAREINQMHCADTATFTLSPGQVKEIGLYHDHVVAAAKNKLKNFAGKKPVIPPTASLPLPTISSIAPVAPPQAPKAGTVIGMVKNTLSHWISGWSDAAIPFVHAQEK